MSDEVIEVNSPGQLIIGSQKESVVVLSLSLTGCTLRLTFKPKLYQQARLRLFDKNADGELIPYRSVPIVIESSSRKPSDPDAYYAKVKFSNAITGNQGVVQTMKAAKQPEELPAEPKVTATSNSVRLSEVECFMCREKNVPFYSLRPRSMITLTNIFGVPYYVDTYPGKEYCDFNLIRVTTCPNCLFASSFKTDFKAIKKMGEANRAPFSIKSLKDPWMEKIEERKKIAKPFGADLFAEKRSVEQATASYDLAVIASDFIHESSQDKDPRFRNYDPARKAVYHLLTKAEMLMHYDKAAEAEACLEQTSERLESFFLYLKNEPSIRAAFLLGMISLYFENYKKVGQYLSFLREFNKNGILEEDSDEFKTLMTNIKNFDEAYQNRSEFSRENLSGFKKPF